MFHEISHPLIDTRLARLRCKSCSSPDFRHSVRLIAAMMVPEVTRDLQTCEVPCETPMEMTTARVLVQRITLVPVLRAGLGFLDGFLELLPDASVAHIGLARDEETLRPEPYYLKYPTKVGETDVIILDPMLATGGSAVEAISSMKRAGAKSVRFACLVAAPEGLEAVARAHPEVDIYAAALDRCLNERGYILPGLGDAGDRMFGTQA